MCTMSTCTEIMYLHKEYRFDMPFKVLNRQIGQYVIRETRANWLMTEYKVFGSHHSNHTH